MNKSQGVAIGAFLLSGLLLRSRSPTSSGQTAPEESAGDHSSVSASSEEINTQGPWIASCNYWASVRTGPSAASSTSPGPPVQIDVTEPARPTVQVEINQAAEELGCDPSRKWGIPNDGRISVETLIATVPDPVHTHLAMVFDRTIDDLLQAAGDNEYTSSNYWLPWKREPTSLNEAVQWGADTEPGHDPERERQPGLVVLRDAHNFYKPIYIFLVAETPTEGINGFQLQNAFLYEDELSRGPQNKTSIIGPFFTGSAESLREAINSELKIHPSEVFEVSGSTATRVAAEFLNNSPQIRYVSFTPTDDHLKEVFTYHLATSGYDLGRLAVLIEDNTPLGAATSSAKPSNSSDHSPLIIRFPREISLLRNAQSSSRDQEGVSARSTPSPFLHLFLGDTGDTGHPTDTIPQFSVENTPLSQEAQLMAISRQLQQYRAEYINIIASNPLDQIFLARFLHRACPDARLLFFSGDLLFEREVDNVPFIGTTTVTAYPLVSTSAEKRAFPASSSEAYYNATYFAIWKPGRLSGNPEMPQLAGYRQLIRKDGTTTDFTQAPLWITAIGTDGYYPLAILSPCARAVMEHSTLPAIDGGSNKPEPICSEGVAGLNIDPRGSSQRFYYPSLLWDMLCSFICVLCIIHSILLLAANYWSPLTRDLAVSENDLPHRRSMYVNIGAATLFSMACIIAVPPLCMSPWVSISAATLALSIATLLAGVAMLVTSLWKVRAFSGWMKSSSHVLADHFARKIHVTFSRNIYFIINSVSWFTLAVIPCLWLYLCLEGNFFPSLSYRGLFFSVRCINPGSGVSPGVPILLLLFGWYIWAFLQTRRLRFSDPSRPRMPAKFDNAAENRFFVSDDDLARRGGSLFSNLFHYITCLFVTRAAVRQAVGLSVSLGGARFDLFLVFAYLIALLYLSIFNNPVHSLNHIFWKHVHIADPYEVLAVILFSTLLGVVLAGWLRILLVWSALRRGLLERLESNPIRFAFSRLKGVGWISMLRQSGLHEQWRDMARSVESMRQMLHDNDLKKILTASQQERLEATYNSLLADIEEVHNNRTGSTGKYTMGKKNSQIMRRIEARFSEFSHDLLFAVLIPFWKDERTGLVEGDENEDIPMKARRWRMQGSFPNAPIQIRAVPEGADLAGVILAEEFLAIRYVALIRAILANMRYLMLFVSGSFVLSIVAWNSYPFEPRQQIDWLFTALLLVLGSGIIWVFAQMYRNPILSRITESRPNELGMEFYIRIVGFGAIPVLTWLAYQFPAVGSEIFKLFQPAVSATQ